MHANARARALQLLQLIAVSAVVGDLPDIFAMGLNLRRMIGEPGTMRVCAFPEESRETFADLLKLMEKQEAWKPFFSLRYLDTKLMAVIVASARKNQPDLLADQVTSEDGRAGRAHVKKHEPATQL